MTIDARQEQYRDFFAAYGWPADLTREEVLERLLILNQERSLDAD